jgi:predicted Zn-dependent protease
MGLFKKATSIFIIGILSLPTVCEAARWQQRRIKIIDTIEQPVWGSALKEAAKNWTEGSIVKLVVSEGGPTSFYCPPSNPIPICAEYYGDTAWIANTQVVKNSKGLIIAASVQVNLDYVQNPPYEELLYIFGHELGHAIAILPHTTRKSSIMNPYIVNPYPDYQDYFQDYLEVNKEDGR